MITYSMLTHSKLLTFQVIQRYPDIDASELWCAGTDCIQTPPSASAESARRLVPHLLQPRVLSSKTAVSAHELNVRESAAKQMRIRDFHFSMKTLQNIRQEHT